MEEGVELPVELPWSYTVEKAMYGTAIVLGTLAVIYTVWRLKTSSSNQWDLAARLIKYKISLTVADLIILFIYAPTQLLWIQTYWWYGGDFYCRFYKFLSTFGFHLTGNMQALIAIDRLNVMTKINKLNKESYNSTVAVVAAWILALACSIPQLFVFYEYNHHGHMQCVSHWTIAFHEYSFKMEEINNYYIMTDAIAAGNTTLADGRPVEYVDPLPFDVDQVEKEFEFYQNLEKVYNGVHLTTIVFLPYLIELISYLIIILLLNAATTGQFMGFRAVVKSVFLKLPCFYVFFRVKDSVRRHTSNARDRRREPKSKRSSERLAPSQPKVLAGKSSSKSQASSPTERPLHFDFSTNGEAKTASYSNGQSLRSPDWQNGTNFETSLESEVAEISVAQINRQKKSDSVLQYKERSKAFWKYRPTTVDPLFKTELRDEQRMIEDQEENAVEYQRQATATPVKEVKIRRMSDPTISGDKKVTRVAAPWMKTVVKARRNTKKKVFVMITINLICWLPYFAHALMSSLKINDEFSTKITFYAALVVFNAISNILL